MVEPNGTSDDGGARHGASSPASDPASKAQRRVLALQLGLLVLVSVVVVALTWARKNGEFAVIAAYGPLALTILGPALSAWNRRVSALAAIGWPLLTLIVSNVAVWVWVAIATSYDPICHGPHAPCEGSGIFLAFYPFFAGATVVVAAMLAGALRGIAWLLATRT